MASRTVLQKCVAGLPQGLTRKDFAEMQVLYFGRDKKKAPAKKDRLAAWEEKPTRQLAADELADVESAGAQWTPLALLGLFMARYETWCGAKYRPKSIRLDYVLVESIVDEVGPKLAAAGIEAMFAKPLDWVGSKTIDFLADPQKWSRFVAPAIAQLEKANKPSGEQAEYRGSSAPAMTVRRRR